MADDRSSLRSFLEELKRRRVVRVAAVYAAVAFVVWQAAEFVLPALAFPAWSVDLVVVITLLGFPVALVLAWAFEVTPEGMARTEPAEAREGRETAAAGATREERRDEPGAGPRAASSHVEPGWLGGRTAVVVGLLILLGFAMGAGWLAPLVPEAPADGGPAEVVRTSLLPPPGEEFYGGHGLVLSPDGRRLAFVTSGPRAPLWVRELDALEARPIPGTVGARSPVWSPDGEKVAFVQDGRLKVTDLRRGGVRTLTEAIADEEGGSWSHDGVILFVGRDGRIYRVSESGGEATPVTERRDEPGHERPFFLPDGRRFLFSFDNAVGVFVGDLGGADRAQLLERGGQAEYAPTGWLLYNTPEEEQTLFARRLDAERLELEGPPVPVATELRTPGGDMSYSVSTNARLVYLARGARGGAIDAGLHVRRDGSVLDTIVAPDSTWQIRWSHAGDAVAFAGWALLVRPLDREVARRLPSPSDFVKLGPVWAPEDSLLAYWTRPSRESVRHEIWAVRPDGTGSRRLAELGSTSFLPSDWSPDGRFLLGIGREDESAEDPELRILDLEDGTLTPWRSEGHRSDDGVAVFSPDGRWVAYEAGAGEVPEIYIAPFPGPGPRVRVSLDGGISPRWRADGRELFYHDPDEGLVAAEVTLAEGAPDVSTRRPVFPEGTLPPGVLFIEPGPGGDRFLAAKRLPASGQETPLGPPSLTLVQNWTAELVPRVAGAR